MLKISTPLLIPDLLLVVISGTMMMVVLLALLKSIQRLEYWNGHIHFMNMNQVRHITICRHTMYCKTVFTERITCSLEIQFMN